MLKQKTATALQLGTPTAAFMVLYGALFKVIHGGTDNMDPTIPSNTQFLFCFIQNETPVFYDQLTELIQRLQGKVNIFASVTGVTEENLNGQLKKYPTLADIQVLSDNSNTVVRIARFAQRAFRFREKNVFLLLHYEHENFRAFWCDKADDVDFTTLPDQAEQEEPE